MEQQDTEFQSVHTSIGSSQKEYGANLGELE